MSVLSREQFLSENKLRTQEFPFGSGKVLAREPDVKILRAWRKSYRKPDGTIDPKKALYAEELLLSFCLVTGDGLPMFSQEEVLNGIFDGLRGPAVSMLCQEVQVFAGLGERDAELQALKDAIKNSSETPTNDTSSN